MAKHRRIGAYVPGHASRSIKPVPVRATLDMSYYIDAVIVGALDDIAEHLGKCQRCQDNEQYPEIAAPCRVMSVQSVSVARWWRINRTRAEPVQDMLFGEVTEERPGDDI